MEQATLFIGDNFGLELALSKGPDGPARSGQVGYETIAVGSLAPRVQTPLLTRLCIFGQKRPLVTLAGNCQQRRKARRLDPSLPSSITCLEAASVAESTQQTYLRYVHELLEAMRWKTLNVSVTQLDRAMVLLCSSWEVEEEGQKPAKGQTLLAGVIFLAPHMQYACAMLFPRTGRALNLSLKGWTSEDGPPQRVGVPCLGFVQRP
eukprot:5782025-Amphidinium_carterae.4